MSLPTATAHVTSALNTCAASFSRCRAFALGSCMILICLRHRVGTPVLTPWRLAGISRFQLGAMDEQCNKQSIDKKTILNSAHQDLGDNLDLGDGWQRALWTAVGDSIAPRGLVRGHAY